MPQILDRWALKAIQAYMIEQEKLSRRVINQRI